MKRSECIKNQLSQVLGLTVQIEGTTWYSGLRYKVWSWWSGRIHRVPQKE